MKRKIRVGIIFGGKSAEHEISLVSARNVVAALDRKKYEPVLIGIDKKGRWHSVDTALMLSRPGNLKLTKLRAKGAPLAVIPAAEKNRQMVEVSGGDVPNSVDVVFPVLHGPFGEDGTVQGLLKLMDVPFVGAGVLGSAVGMDKDVQKRLLREAGIPTARFMVLENPREAHFDRVARKLGLPFFIKPANLGSSVGIHKVKTKKQFLPAVRDAFRYDRKILIEEYIAGREIECAVLGNEKPIASIPGEIIPRHEFYSYEAKYIDENGAALIIPAKLQKHVIEKIRRLAVRTFKTLCLEGMARIDLFLKKNGAMCVNEANTIPGFTNISMYPKLWEASGIPYPKLIEKLIELAIERHKKEKRLKTSYTAS